MDGSLYARYLHRLFWASILVKGLDGVLETIGGILVLLASRADLINIVIFLTAPELAEDQGMRSPIICAMWYSICQPIQNILRAFTCCSMVWSRYG